MSVLICQGDARQLPLADESVHMIVTSPPYNAGLPYDSYDDWLPWQEYWDELVTPAIHECYRVLTVGGRLCLNFANVLRADIQPMRLTSSRCRRVKTVSERARRNGRLQIPGANGEAWSVMVAPLIWSLLKDIGFLPREQITWVKADNPADRGTHSTAWGTWCSAQNPVLRAVSEPIFVADKVTHSREPGLSDLTPVEFKAWTRNTWSICTDAEQSHSKHPATFPLELPRRLIKLYSYVGDVVLDPFAGSGTTVLAAKVTGRVGIGVELSERYCRLARNRTAQDVLFPSPMLTVDPAPIATQPALLEAE